MTSLTLDLTSLSEEQLAALALVDPNAVKSEIERRNAYGSVSEFFTDLAQSALDLEQIMATYGDASVVVKVIKKAGILRVLQRGLAWASHQDIPFEDAAVRQIDMPRRGQPKAA